MKCPVCFSVMENRDERHSFGPEYIRMNLNCVNFDCMARKKVGFGTHMGVLLHYDDPWKCYEYNLPFSIGKWWLILVGRGPGTGDHREWSRSYPGHQGMTKIEPRFMSPEDWFKIKKYISDPVPFVSISTGDDMHEHATRVFEEMTKELKRLSHFS